MIITLYNMNREQLYKSYRRSLLDNRCDELALAMIFEEIEINEMLHINQRIALLAIASAFMEIRLNELKPAQ